MQELDIRSRPKLQLLVSIYYQAPKTSGVEPGFEATQKVDLLFEIYKAYPNNESRWQFINSHQANIERLCQVHQAHLPKYLVKSDYRNISNGMVIPEKEDLKRSKTIKNLYKKGLIIGEMATFVYIKVKQRSSIEINQEVVKEVLANDLVRAYGIPTQKQYLLRSSYEDGRLKMMLKSEWLQGATILGPLHGGQDQGYRASAVILPTNGILYFVDTRIKNLASSLPTMIVIGDPDGIGSEGQNKLILNEQFTCIDTGHAFAANIIDKITPFFSVKEATFKNYSIFYAARSEIMPGIIRLAKQVGYLPSDAVLKSYGIDFYRGVRETPVGIDALIFDDYINKIREIRKEFVYDTQENIENSRCCDAIVDDLLSTKKVALSTRNRLVEKFKQYLYIQKNALDVLDSIEKILVSRENTTLRSADNTTLLACLRIDETKVNWRVAIPEKQEGLCKFSLYFDTPLAFAKAKEILDMWLVANKCSEEDASEFFVYQKEANSILFSFDYSKIRKLTSLFNEEKVAKSYHPKDYALLKYYQSEQELLQLAKAFKEFGFEIGIKLDINQSSYELIFNYNEETVDSTYLIVLNRNIENFSSRKSLAIPPESRAVLSANNLLRSILFEFKREQQIVQKIAAINKVAGELKGLEPPFIFHIGRLPQNCDLSVKLETNTCSAMFQRLIQEQPFCFETVDARQLEDIEEKLNGYIQEYRKRLNLIESERLQLEKINTFLKASFGLSCEPLTIKQEQHKFRISISGEFPKVYLIILKELLSNFDYVSGFYHLEHKQLAIFRHNIELASDIYLQQLADNQRSLTLEIEKLNLMIKAFFHIDQNFLSVKVNATNIFLHTQNTTTHPLKEVTTLFISLKPITKEKILVVLEEAKKLLKKYEMHFCLLMKINQQLHKLFNIDYDCFKLNFVNGALHLEISNFLDIEETRHMIAVAQEEFQQQKQTLALSDLLNNISKNSFKIVESVTNLILNYKKVLGEFLDATLKPLSLTGEIVLKISHGKLRFNFNNCDEQLVTHLTKELEISKVDSIANDYDIEKIKMAIESATDLYLRKKDKDELESDGFQFLEAETSSDHFGELIQKLKDLHAYLIKENHSRSNSLLTLTMSYFTTAKSSNVTELITYIQNFINEKDLSMLGDLTGKLEAHLKEIPKQNSIDFQFLLTYQALHLCTKLLKQSDLSSPKIVLTP